MVPLTVVVQVVVCDCAEDIVTDLDCTSESDPFVMIVVLPIGRVTVLVAVVVEELRLAEVDMDSVLVNSSLIAIVAVLDAIRAVKVAGVKDTVVIVGLKDRDASSVNV